jgi:hypothetical protein
MSFSSSRGRSSTSFRNLHTRANRPRCQLTELWERATGPLVGCAKRYMARLTWRGSRALDGASIAISSEPSDAEVQESVPERVKSAKGSSRLHEFVDIGVPGTVSTRRASCHQCEQCWAGNRRECLNKAYCGSPIELQIEREHTPTTSLSRVITSDPNPHP